MTSEKSERRQELKELSDEELIKYSQIAAVGTAGKKLVMEELARRHLQPKANAYWNRLIQFRIVLLVIICATIVGILIFRRFHRGDWAPNQANSPPPTQSEPEPSK